jgi:hypothetical protein
MTIRVRAHNANTVLLEVMGAAEYNSHLEFYSVRFRIHTYQQSKVKSYFIYEFTKTVIWAVIIRLQMTARYLDKGVYNIYSVRWLLCQYFRTFSEAIPSEMSYEHGFDSQQLESYGYSNFKMIWTLRRKSRSIMHPGRNKTRLQTYYQRDRGTPHLSRNVMEYLNENLQCQRIRVWWSSELATAVTGPHPSSFSRKRVYERNVHMR